MSIDIKVEDVSKQYNGVNILTDINLEIEEGTTAGIVGSNGSGKSVLFKIISGFTAPDKGNVWIRDKKLGKDMDFPEDMGIFINSPGYISLYNGFKNLKLLADIRGNIDDKKIVSTMELVGLDPNNKTKVDDYSLGMKQKLGIAQAVMENQDIIILDEPFNSLDYKTYNDIKVIITKLQAQNKTIMLTSHNFEDIQELCDIIYIIEEGRLEILNDKLKEKYFKNTKIISH